MKNAKCRGKSSYHYTRCRSGPTCNKAVASHTAYSTERVSAWARTIQKKHNTSSFTRITNNLRHFRKVGQAFICNRGPYDKIPSAFIYLVCDINTLEGTNNFDGKPIDGETHFDTNDVVRKIQSDLPAPAPPTTCPPSCPLGPTGRSPNRLLDPSSLASRRRLGLVPPCHDSVQCISFMVLRSTGDWVATSSGSVIESDQPWRKTQQTEDYAAARPAD